MIIRFQAILASVVLALTACAPAVQEPAGMVIKNARVIDGSGGPAREVSVRVVADRITSVGNFDPLAGDTIVDADGLVLAPGFIDSHSHHDGGLFEMPGALATVNQGITTIIAGQDGSHNYPLAEFFTRLETTPVAINVASFAGQGPLRRQIMGEDYQRYSTPEELAEMMSLLRTEMEAGALGFSTGLEYDPGSFSSYEELVELASVAASFEGRYTSHIRNEDQYFWEAVDEAINVGRDANIPVRVTHIKLAMARWWGQADRLIALMDETRASGIDLTVDVYPSSAWYANFSWFRTLFPERDLDRREGADYILNDMLAPDRILLPDYQPEPAYFGMTIAQIAALRETDPATTLMDLLKAEAAMDDDRPSSGVLAFAMDEPDIEKIMAWPHSVIGSDGDSRGAHPRGYSAFTRFLGHYIRERDAVTLEEGIRKITSLPALQAGITDRGLIQAGQYADLVLFNPNTVKDNAEFGNPHLISSGIEKVWVNGQLVYEGGRTTDNRPGKPIRSKPKTNPGTMD